jgi:cell wall-associated NlpC family hydrolase
MAREMRYRLLPPLLCLSLVLPAVAAGAAKQSWAQREIRVVTSRGLLGGSATNFKPDAPLTQAALADLVAGLTDKEPAAAADPSAPVTMAKLDSKLVSALALGADAATFAGAARAAGLAPPSRFGTEVVARLLGLRTNHPTGQDALELLPNDPATRAEAAFSAAQILGFNDWSLQEVSDDAAEFELPDLTPWQRKILKVAVSFIGYPYVWGGTSEHPQTPLGLSTPGGFDCSGFVWRVYKLQSYAGAPQLGGVLRGRTTMQMSGEVPKSQRIGLDDLQPADVMFFGARGPKSTPAQVNHAAIYLGDGWLIQSSGYGVALARVDGWYANDFAWGRRPLTEAKLS